MSARTRIAASLAVAGAATAAFAFPAPAFAADGTCQAAGIATLKSIDMFKEVRDNGITVGAAVGYGVAPRDGLPEGFTLDTVIDFKTLLADHRAGDDSIFIYPWCE